MIKEKVDSIIQSLLNPFENLKGLGSTVLDQFVKLFGLVSDVKEGYNKLKIGYNQFVVFKTVHLINAFNI